MSKRDKVIEFLRSKGYREISSNSKKYIKFSSDRPNKFYFVGKNGALRVGPNVSGSISMFFRI